MATDDVLNAIFRFKFERPSDVQTAAFCEELLRVVDGVVGAIVSPPVEDESVGIKQDGNVKECGAKAQGGVVANDGGEKNDDAAMEEDGYVAVDGRDVVMEDSGGEESDYDESVIHLDPLLHDRNVPLEVFTASDRVFLERARREYSGRAHGEAVTPTKGEIWTHTWYPKYGSVLQMECTSAGTVQLRLLALDGWKRAVHHLPGNQCIHSAVPEGHDVWHCGEMDLTQYAKFGPALTKQLNAAKDRTKNERHGTLGDGPGHQKTPAFLCSAIRSALTEGKTIYQPTGGSTDVGKHTGGPPRDTCWPLVRLALKQALPGSRGLFEKVLIRLKSTLLDKQLKRLRWVNQVQDFWRAADMAFAMLQATVSMITAMLDRGYVSSLLEHKCARWREEIDALVQRWSNHVERSFVLPHRELMERISSSSRCPLLPRPHPQNLLDARGTFTSGRDKALAENRGYEYVDASTCTTEELVQYLFTPSLHADQVAVGQRLVEMFMYRLAKDLGSSNAVTACEPSSLLKITNWYRARRTTFGTDRKYDQVVRVTTDSQLLLMSWVAFCVCHKTCCASYKQLRLHKIALDWKRLNVAVLPEKDARVALQQVAAYIKTWNERTGLQPSVFNFSDPAGSILLARAMGQHLSDYPAMYQRHVSARDADIARMWANVDGRKRRVKQLRSDLVDERQRLEKAEAEVRDEREVVARRRNSSQYASCVHLEELEKRVRRLSKSIENMTNELEGLLKLHEFYVSPLPVNRIEALAVLFLNYLPPDLDILSELCGLAQRELGLTDSLKYRVSPPCDTSWAAHIADHGHGCFSEARTKYVTEFPLQLDVPKNYGPATIDEVFSEDQFARLCAWYPDGNNDQMFWKDPSRSFVNPFMIPESDSIKNFTIELPNNSTSVQWSVEYPGGSTRGNLTYAKSGVIDAASEDFAAYVALGSLRCYPVQQLRRLFEAIQTNSLDWSDHVVGVVAKQAAFQVGVLTDDTVPLFEWHADLERAVPLNEFSGMIASLGDHMSSSPSSWVCIPLLGEIAGFLNQFQPGDRRAVRSLSQTGRQWALEHRNKWLSGVPTDERINLRTRECLLYGFALTCYSFGPCDTEDLSSICELIILFANAYLFATGEQREDVREVKHVVRRVMATRIVKVIEYVARSPSDILSRLCALVNDRVPSGLQWIKVASDGGCDRVPCCFEAVDAARKVHYLVNLFTGSVLTNGLPPGGLPLSIREHEQLLMLFGDQDFEVIRQGDVYSTAQKLGDCAYSFRLVDGSLLVEETSSLARLQSCTDAWLNSFDSVFPATLSSLYAFWYWEERDCVLLREKLVANRGVVFVVTFENSWAMCYEVPRSDRSMTYSDILSRTKSYRVFVTPNEALSHVFRKFEDLSFVHVMISPEKRLEIALPRYGLRFVQDDHGQLASTEYRGYCLSTNQRLLGQLYRFQRYLVLESASATCEMLAKRLLFPCGRVVGLPDGMVDIKLSESPAASIPLCVVEEHPRLRTYSAESTEHQLLLAAVYSACDNLVPWKALSMTGGQAANDLLRGCPSSQPFSEFSTHALRDIHTFSHLTTTSRLKGKELEDKALQLAFLVPEVTSGCAAEVPVNELDAYASCSRLATIHACRFRGTMTSAEEHSTLGVSVLRVLKASFRDSLRPLVELGKVPVEVGFIHAVEMVLQGLTRTRPRIVTPAFPLATSAFKPLGLDMVEDLKVSWAAYHEPRCELAVDLRELAAKCRQELYLVKKKQALVWRYLCCAVDAARDTPKERLMAMAGFLPALTETDVLRSVLDKATLMQFTAALSKQGRSRFTRAAVRFMELCVLEDKLDRIVSRAEAASPPAMEYFVEELTCVREWKTNVYPFWLVFEVEGRLQIRPEQYIVAKHLINNPGSICQLNMGRGKTRVILPMLFLYYRYKAAGRVVRAHFLSPLLSETREFMHRVLSSGSLRLPFVELPFNRTIELSLRQVLLMQEAVNDVKQNGGFMLVAPEHRLSLELKRREIEQSEDPEKKPLCDALDALLQSSQYVDVFDESDALLHHKYHLVYAVGSPEVLDGGSYRWVGAEALLRVLMSPASKRVRGVLETFPDLFTVQTEYGQRCGAYNGFILSTAIEASADSRVALKKALVEDLIDHASFEMSWLRVVCEHHPVVRSDLVAALCDCQLDCDTVLAKLPIHLDGVRLQFLALRGLMAYGVLENCLEKRNRVTFGLPDAGTRKKALAIPFTAADLPAERSEFSHPDVSIVLTLLAYYHAGLTKKDVRRAFELLLRLDVSERTQYYSDWFKSVETQVAPELVELLSDLDHVSLDNAHQFAVLYYAYRYSMEVINFYLNRRVFPRDTQQYPHRLSRTAWDLVKGPTNIGFSGTNDTHRLLPVGVTQREPDRASLRGTNGKMIDLLLTSTKGYAALVDSDFTGASVPTWQLLLQQALSKHCTALIDTGALLAGLALDDAAQFLIEQDSFTGDGVTYYDTRKHFNCWVVLERAHLLVRPLKTSSVHERDTFVIFDEARSRGSDMKLCPDALGLLTLAPTITKDKLMQGAGRLRQLGRNQKLWFSSTSEVEHILRHRCDQRADSRRSDTIQVVDILEWVMQNTQQQSTAGLLEWAHNGVQFCANLASADNELQDEDWTLTRLYGDAVADVAMYDVIQHQLSATRIVEQVASRDVAAKIDSHAQTYGRDDMVHVTGFGEECERELQIEEEEEVEAERPSAKLEPRAEVDWDYDMLLSATCVADLRTVRIKSAYDAVKEMVASSALQQIAWASTKLYGTRNFWATVVPPSGDPTFVWTGFLRLANVAVTFRDGSVLLLSEREADAVLKMLLVAQGGVGGDGCFGVVHVGFAARAIHSDTELVVSLAEVPLSLGFERGHRCVPRGMAISVIAIVACQLLNGETQFAARKHACLMERVLRDLLGPLGKREETLRGFLEARRLQQRWSRSFLQDIANRMDLEDYEMQIE